MKSTNHPLFISILALTYPHFSFVFCSFIVRSLFVLCSSFVRHLFVICSSFVRHLFVICSSFLRLTFPLLHSLSLGEGWGEDILFVFSLSARAARTVICSFIVRSLFVICSFFVRSLFVISLSACRATTARVAHTCPCGSHRLSYKLSISTLFYSSVPIC